MIGGGGKLMSASTLDHLLALPELVLVQQLVPARLAGPPGWAYAAESAEPAHAQLWNHAECCCGDGRDPWPPPPQGLAPKQICRHTGEARNVRDSAARQTQG